MGPNLSYDDKMKVHKLTQERVNGRFRNDAKGFALELLEVVQNSDSTGDSGANVEEIDVIEEIF